MIVKTILAVEKLFNNNHFYNIVVSLVIILLPTIPIFIYFYRENLIDKTINSFIELKLNKDCDSVLIYDYKSLFSGYIKQYVNTYDVNNVESDLPLLTIISILKSKGYNYYTMVKIPISNIYIVVFWYKYPNKETLTRVEHEIHKVNKLFDYRSIIQTNEYQTN